VSRRPAHARSVGNQERAPITTRTLLIPLCVHRLAALARLARLSSLSLRQAQNITSLEPLASTCSALTNLEIYEASQLMEITPLVNCGQLSSLTLTGAFLLKDLMPLAFCGHLSSLTLRGLDGIGNYQLRDLLNKCRLVYCPGKGWDGELCYVRGEPPDESESDEDELEDEEDEEEESDEAQDEDEDEGDGGYFLE